MSKSTVAGLCVIYKANLAGNCQTVLWVAAPLHLWSGNGFSCPKTWPAHGVLTAMIDGQWDLTVPWACMCFFTICIHSLWWNGFCPVSNWIVSFVTIKFREHVTYHRYESFVRDTVYKYFLPICCLSFSWGLLKSSLQNFCWGPICQFFLLPIKLLVSRSCAGP